MRIDPISPRTRRFDEVIALHGQFRKTLGFLPAGAFAEYAGDGTLLGAIAEDGSLAAYALYDLPRNEVALRHLCVAAAMRGQGIARELVDALVLRHPDRTGIRVRCRRDWAANHVWPRLDFEPLDERPGRSAEGHLLTTWWRDFGQPNLLSTVPLSTPATFLVALDTDVFIDLSTTRAGSEESQQLVTDWVLELVELFITKEVAQEIYNHDDPGTRRQQRTRLTYFRRIDAHEAAVKHATALLQAALPERPSNAHDDADLRHVARAHAAGASFFLSRDQDLIKRFARPSEEHLGLRVVNPAAFLQELWALDQPLAYAPASLANTTFSIGAFMPTDEAACRSVFLNQQLTENSAALRQRLRSYASQPTNWQVMVVRDGSAELRGLFVRGVENGVLRVPLIRVAGRSKPTLARHLLHLQRSHACALGVDAVVVDDPYPSTAVVAALPDEGFVEGQGRWSAATITGSVSATGAAQLLRMATGPSELKLEEVANRLQTGNFDRVLLAAIEDQFWPIKICEPDLPTYLVPVRAAFAEQLFDTALSEQTLFARSDSLGLSREHVYYKSPARGSVSAPARILWYVSKQSRVLGTGAVRACSLLNEVVIDRPRTLHRRFRRLGVYRQRDVEAACRNGQAMALRFTNTELFASPIPLEDLREIAREQGHTLSVRSARQVSERMFEEVYRRGTTQ